MRSIQTMGETIKAPKFTQRIEVTSTAQFLKDNGSSKQKKGKPVSIQTETWDTLVKKYMQPKEDKKTKVSSKSKSLQTEILPVKN